MKRISISRFAPGLALVASFALGGCIGQTSTTEGTSESDVVSNRTHDVANGDDNTAVSNGGAPQVLELKVRPSDANQNPHPEPWLDQENPHPEPWQSKNISFAPPDPNGGSKKP